MQNDRTASISEGEIKHIVAEAVKQTLIQIGIDAQNPLEMQQDFQHLRSWRESTESLKQKGLLTILGIFIAGGIGLMVAGFKSKYLP